MHCINNTNAIGTASVKHTYGAISWNSRPVSTRANRPTVLTPSCWLVA